MNRLFGPILVVFGLLGLSNAAFAQQNVTINCLTGTSSTGFPIALPASSTNPCPVAATVAPAAPTAVTATPRGITLTTGGTDQTIAAANASRKSLVIQNPCSATTQGIAAAESVFVNINAAATTTGNGNFAELQACQSVTLSIASGLIDQEAVHVIAATTGHVIYAKEF